MAMMTIYAWINMKMRRSLLQVELSEVEELQYSFFSLLTLASIQSTLFNCETLTRVTLNSLTPDNPVALGFQI